MCRKRGRIVLVGVVGLELSRADFFEKELSFQVSCSYGPGRYDPEYEEKGHDYPIGYVRWTEQRNFEAFLDMVAEGRVDLLPLISHRFDIDHAKEAYDLISGESPSLGVLLDYPRDADDSLSNKRVVSLASSLSPKSYDSIRVGFIGAGNYASQVLIPAFRKTDSQLCAVVSASGVSAVNVGRKLGIEQASTDSDTVIAGGETNTIVITTRHDSHARYVCAAITAGKNVFVEKPLALNANELDSIRSAYESANDESSSELRLMVGFNRRFAPQIVELKRLLENSNAPKCFVFTVNAGEIPSDHWTQDPSIGGGRIVGEGCHFIDLLRPPCGFDNKYHSSDANRFEIRRLYTKRQGDNYIDL